MKKEICLESLMSYKERGPYGDTYWRGNTSGYLIKDLINHFQAKNFADVCEGSGTSRDVCKELGVDYYGFDLHSGFDFTHDYLLKKVPCPLDIVFSHPPYHDMIKYSGHQWGGTPHPSDTSRCHSVDEFLEKSQVMLLNQREATRDGGIYCTLIGDQRNKELGFKSYQADLIQLLPKNELLSVVIKHQSNPSSTWKPFYGHFIPILHEYLIIWKKTRKCIFQISLEVATSATQLVAKTWRNAIRLVFMKLGRQATLSEIYKEVEKVAAHLIEKNRHWKEKIRQTLQRHYSRVERGVWSI